MKLTVKKTNRIEMFIFSPLLTGHILLIFIPYYLQHAKQSVPAASMFCFGK